MMGNFYDQYLINDNISVFQTELLFLNLAIKHILHFTASKMLSCSDYLSSIISFVNIICFEKLVVHFQNIINEYDINVDFTHTRTLGHSNIRAKE